MVTLNSKSDGRNRKPIAYHLQHLLLLLLLSHFSHVRLCENPKMAAHQASLSLGFSRKEHWSGVPFPSPMCESEVVQMCPTLHDAMDCSLPGSSIHGIFQAIYFLLKFNSSSQSQKSVFPTQFLPVTYYPYTICSLESSQSRQQLCLLLCENQQNQMKILW